ERRMNEWTVRRPAGEFEGFPIYIDCRAKIPVGLVSPPQPSKRLTGEIPPARAFGKIERLGNEWTQFYDLQEPEVRHRQFEEELGTPLGVTRTKMVEGRGECQLCRGPVPDTGQGRAAREGPRGDPRRPSASS